jgi:cell division inhibitor SepF
MAPSFMKKTMVYLGLLDDEYDEYDDLEDRAPRGFSSPTRVEPRATEHEQPPDEFSGGMSRVRTLPRESAVPSQTRQQPSTVAPRPTPVRPVPVDTTISPTAAASSARVHVVAPSRFGDAKEIADRLKDSRPVIVNLQMADRDLQRRMIDFCSGVTYALSGEMEKVADQVFLLTPTNVKVSDEERQRLADRGFGRD